MIESRFFFPETMIHLPNWILWKLEERNERLTKVPYQINGKHARPDTSSTWSSYQSVNETFQQNSGKYQGIGIVLSKENHLVFIDIDHCIDGSGNYDSRARDILETFTDDNGDLMTYVELSQSGTGLHLVVMGNIPRSFNNRTLHVEMYDTGRFIAMTGRAISAREPCEYPEGITYVFERYKTAKKTNDGTERPKVDPTTRRSDEWIIYHASTRIGNSNKFPALFRGDWGDYQSQSEADLALCKILAFWTNNDPESIDRIFRQSGLYRAKWERQDYRDRTISTAINDNDDTLYEFNRRKKLKVGEAFFAEFN